ncbi:MAG TPA: serine/threonine-protein kinase [Thermoanaerobaculia bacterium]|nr:serine/threonine-protein kinase [Thermoanaerobaculia bacterium]
MVADRYEVKAYLGRGGNATVYRVYDRYVKVEVALKLVHPDLDPERALRRLSREVEIAREVSSPYLVRVFDLGRTNEDIYLTMELLGGGSLRRRLDSGPLPLSHAVGIAESVLRGLAELHDHGAVHRDVTPGNVLFSSKDEAKLADFGLARRPEQDETAFTARDAILGTEGYRSPEQALGKELGPRCDLYSLGVVLFEMLVGRLPHEAAPLGPRLSILEAAPDVRRFRPEVPPWLARIVARLLEVRLANRYQSAEEVLADLTHEKSPRRVRLRRYLFRSAAVLLLCLPQVGVLVVPAPEAEFSHLIQLESGIAAIGTRGEQLWTLPGADPETADKWALARIEPGGSQLLALVPGQAFPEDVSTLTFFDPLTGKVRRQVKLPSGANYFPNDPPRFSIASVKALDLFHDGTDEVIVNYRHVPEAPSYVVLYAPRLNEARVIYYARGGQSFEGAADLDGDGIPELLFAGIDNAWNWVNVVAAVRLAPNPSDPESWRTRVAAAAPDLVAEPADERSLLWYAVVPRGYLDDPRRLTIDEKRRELTVHYQFSGKTWTLDFDGFPPGTSGADLPKRQEARLATYAHFRETERLRKAVQLDLAMSEATAALDSAKRARETWLSEYAERLQAKILVAEGKIPEAEALFTSLVGRAEDAPEVAYDAGVAFHLAGDLHRAVTWYEKGIGRGSAMGAGKMKHEFLKGEVLALVEEKRYADALSAVARFEATYPAFQGQLGLFRGYVRWRAGKRPEADPAGVHLNSTDLYRYWEMEFEFADGGDRRELLARVDRFRDERPETSAEALSLRAELLGRLGRTREAAETAQSALELAQGEVERSIIARGHLDLLKERAQRLGSGFRLPPGNRPASR